MEPVAAYLGFFYLLFASAVKYKLVFDVDPARVRYLKEIEAAQQSRFTVARRAYYRKDGSFFERKRYPFQDVVGTETLMQIFNL